MQAEAQVTSTPKCICQIWPQKCRTDRVRCGRTSKSCLFWAAKITTEFFLTYLKSFKIGTPFETAGALSRAENHYLDHWAVLEFEKPVLVERLLKGEQDLLQVAQFATGIAVPTVQRAVFHSENRNFVQDGLPYTGDATLELYAASDDDRPLLSLTFQTNWNPNIKSRIKVSRLWRDPPSSDPVRMEMDFKMKTSARIMTLFLLGAIFTRRRNPSGVVGRRWGYSMRRLAEPKEQAIQFTHTQHPAGRERLRRQNKS